MQSGEEQQKNRKLKLGIIGPGFITVHLMQHLNEIINGLESIILYDHGGDFSKRFIEHRQTVFNTVALPFNWVMGVISIGLLNIVLIEVAKWFFRSRQINSAKINL